MNTKRLLLKVGHVFASDNTVKVEELIGCNKAATFCVNKVIIASKNNL